jgi:uncharacterized protein
MGNRGPTRCTAFEGSRRIASGELSKVALKTKKIIDRGEQAPVLIFDDVTSEQIEVDFRGTAEEVLERLEETSSEGAAADPADPEGEMPRGPGRPPLGVVGREVTLLPRHWDWLNRQPGGASVALRKLVEEAIHVHKSRDRVRQSQEAAYRFMSTMAGNLPGFEEATRALFTREQERFVVLIRGWPKDIRKHLLRLVEESLTN